MFLIFANDCLHFSTLLFKTRYDWTPQTTFYYHWYHLQSSTLSLQQISQIKYTRDFGSDLGLNPNITFEQFKLDMALKYPDLIENAQFIHCSEIDDPTHKFAGRMPYFKEITEEKPEYDHIYALQHFYGYRERYFEYGLWEELTYKDKLSDWRKQFMEHHKYYGEYYRLVHEYPNTSEYRSYDPDPSESFRPSDIPPHPRTIVKEPKGAYIYYFTCSLMCVGLFSGVVTGIFLTR